jgi:murein DD-endopeptidase MepM/ murein hydrolase activator NlpD/phage-related protein
VPGFSVGSATVDIVPDARGFQQKLDAQLRNVRIKVDAVFDENGVRERIERATRDASATIKAEVDGARASAELDRIAHDRTTNIEVDVDGGGQAEAQLDAIARDRKVNVDVDSSSVARLGATASASTGIIGALAAAGAALGPTIVPAAGAAAAAILAIGPAAITSAGGIGVLVAGLRNVFGAVSETLKAQDAIGLSAMKAARTQVDSASQVAAAQQALEGAEAGLANARATASAAATRSAQAIIDAQQGIKDATIEAARGVQEAQQRAADSVQSAVNRQVAAERTLSQALLSEEQAQRSLSDARRQAKRDLEDINNSLADGQLSQRQAALDVQTTYDALVQSQDSGSRIEREQAQLAYDRATQRQKELAQDQARLGDDAKKANKAGVEGSPQVEAAKRDLAVAQVAVKDARVAFVEASNGIKKAQADGQKAIAEAQERGAKAINAAERSLSDARKARTEQQRQSAYSVEQAQRGVVSAQRSLADASEKTAASSDAAASALDRQAAALAKLSPEGRALAAFLTGTFIPAYTDFIRDVIEPPLAGGLLQFFKEAEPALRPIQSLFENLAVALGDLFVAAGKALGSSFWVDFFDLLADQAGPATKGIGTFIGNILTGLAGLMTAFEPIAKDIGGFLLDISEQFRDFGTGKSDGLQKFVSFIQDNGPDIADDLGAIALAFGDIIVAAAPIGVAVLNVLGDLARKIDDLDPDVLTGIITGIVGIVATVGTITSIISAFSAVGAALSFIATPLGAIVAGVTLLAVGFVTLYKNSKPFRDFVNEKLLPVLKKLKDDALDGIKNGLEIVKRTIDENKPTLDQMFTDFKKVADFIVEKVLPLFGPLLKTGFETTGIVIATFITNIVLLYKAFKKAWEIIQPIVKDLWSGIKSAWEDHIKPALGSLKRFITEDLPTAFSNGVTAVGIAWDKIKEIAKKPIKFVVNTVLEDGILKGFRAISKLVGFDAGANFHITKMATGGILPGYTPGRDVHRFVSPTAGVLDLSGGEGIARPELVRAIGGDRWDAANKAARQGRVDEGLRYLGGFAEGTRRLFRPVRGGRITQGIHGSPPAIDFGVPVGSPLAAGATGRVVRSEDIRGYEPRNAVQNGFRSYGRVVEVLSDGFRMLYAHLSRRDVKVGQNVAGGQIIGLSGNTGNSSGPHLHYGVSGRSPFDFVSGSTSYSQGQGTGSRPGGPGGLPPAQFDDGELPSASVDWASELRDRIKKPLAQTDNLGSSLWEQMAKKIPKFVGNMLVNKAKDFIGEAVSGEENYTSKGSAAGFSAEQTKNAATIASVGSSMGRRAQIIGIATSIVESGLRNLNYGDRDSVGLFQQRAPWGSFAARTNPRMSAGMFFHGGRGGQRGLDDIPNWQNLPLGQAAQAVQVSAFPGRYAQEVSKATAILDKLKKVNTGGYDNGGWLQPGTTVVQNNTGKPEPVFNPTQWKLLERMASGDGRGGGRVVNIEKVETADHRSLARDIQSQWLLEDALYPTWG